MINAKAKNTALLGAVSLLVPLPEQAFLSVLAQHVPAGTAQVNETAFAVGRQIGAAALGGRTRQEVSHVE